MSAISAPPRAPDKAATIRGTNIGGLRTAVSAALALLFVILMLSATAHAARAGMSLSKGSAALEPHPAVRVQSGPWVRGIEQTRRQGESF